MPIIRKRRAPATVEEDEEDASQNSTPVPRSRQQRPQQRTQTSRRGPPQDEEDDVEEEDASNYGGGEASGAPDADSTGHQQMVKNLVRLALASEYSRTPIRRADISARVLGMQGRQFRLVFDAAQYALRDTFGMELVELPVRERVTLNQRRAAQKTAAGAGSAAGAGAASSKAWILRSVLPEQFHTPEILAPPMVPTAEAESAYVGLYSFVVSLITLSGGSLAESKLERYLRRVNADQSTPVDKTDKLFARMVKEGYIVKIKESIGGEEVVEYMVGTRGKTEVGDDGVTGMVRTVYGSVGDTEDELEKRLERSLRVNAANRGNAQPAEQSGHGEPPPVRKRGRPRRGPDADDMDEDGDGDASE